MKASIQATLTGLPKGVNLVPRAQVKYRYRYEVQTRREGFSWTQSTGTDDWNTAVGAAGYQVKLGCQARIVDNGDPDKIVGV